MPLLRGSLQSYSREGVERAINIHREGLVRVHFVTVPIRMPDAAVDAQGMELFIEYVSIVRKHGQRSKKARSYLRSHDEFRRELNPLIELLNFFWEAKEVGAL